MLTNGILHLNDRSRHRTTALTRLPDMSLQRQGSGEAMIQFQCERAQSFNGSSRRLLNDRDWSDCSRLLDAWNGPHICDFEANIRAQ